MKLVSTAGARRLDVANAAKVRSVFRISCLFLRPRPWQFEIGDSTDE